MKTEILDKSYRRSVVVKADSNAAFEALTMHIDKWWGETDSSIGKRGDVFKISFGEAYWVFEVTDYEPGRTLSWRCIESHQVHNGLEGIEEEWLGTETLWSIEDIQGDEVRINFVHNGLIPDFICYDVCSSAWDFFITDSLKNFLEKGEGKPE